MTYLLDANSISYLLKGDERLKALIADKLWQGDKVMIPRVAYYEVKRGLLARGATAKMQRFMNWASLLGTVGLTDDTLDIAAQVYADLSKKGRLIEDDDIRNSEIAFPDLTKYNNLETYVYLGEDGDELYNSLWKEVKSE